VRATLGAIDLCSNLDHKNPQTLRRSPSATSTGPTRRRTRRASSSSTVRMIVRFGGEVAFGRKGACRVLCEVRVHVPTDHLGGVINRAHAWFLSA
jgi:pantothenate kinase